MFLRKFLTSATLAGSLFTLGLAASATAATVSLTYEGGTASGTATITAAPVAYPGSGSWPKTVGAFGFNMSDSTGTLGDFVAWCLDVSHFLATSGVESYEITETPFTNSYGLDAAGKARVQAVFDANFAGLALGNATQAAGFQVALWNALYDADWNAAAGIFSVAAGAVANQANAYLAAAASYAGGKAYKLTFLQSTGKTTRQNLVTVNPVPVPAAGLMLLAALGGLGALRRRKS